MHLFSPSCSCSTGSGLHKIKKAWLPVSENINPFIRTDWRSHSLFHSYICLCSAKGISYGTMNFVLANVHNKNFLWYKFHRVAYYLYKQLKYWNRRVKTAALGYRFIDAELLKWKTNLNVTENVQKLNLAFIALH